jgi:hypothetical protein
MSHFLKKDLKVGSLLVGGQVGFSPIPLQAELDVVDVHGYWQHPVFPRQEWSTDEWTIRNVPMAGVAGGGALGPMAMMRPANKPYICTEYSHPAPNTYGSESLPLLAAYAALQDWDAIFAFAYSHRGNDWDTRRFSSFFDLDQHPAKLATIPTAVNLFCRGDLQSPATRSLLTITPGQALEATRLGGPTFSAETFGTPVETLFLRPVAMAFGGEAKSSSPSPAFSPEQPLFASDQGGALTWENSTQDRLGVVTINTAKTKGVIGAGTGRRFTLGELSITPGSTLQNWSVILVTELDRPAKPRRAPKRYLITATGYTENTAMGWKNRARNSVGEDWGTAPSLVEGVAATVEFTASKPLRAWALDERGQRTATVTTSKGTIRIGPEYRTLWYEVEIP